MGDITQNWVKVLMPFSENYNLKITASEFKKKNKIPQQTASRILNELVKDNLIEYDNQGKNKLFYLSKKNTSKILLNIVEAQKAIEFLIKNKKIAILINEILEHCEGIILFGSYASGKFDEKSDVDLIILEGNKKKIKIISERFSNKPHLQYIAYKEFEISLKEKNALGIEIMQNHILFGDISKIIKIIWRIANG